MKYTFDVSYVNGENIAKVELAFGSGVPPVAKTININDCGQNFDGILHDMIDNLRLTVKEREEAIYNTEIFKSFIKNSLDQTLVQDEMIVEGGI